MTKSRKPPREPSDVVPPMVIPADPLDQDVLERIRLHLDGGGLLAYPTETVYGFGARVDQEGVRGVVDLKGREESKPMLVLLPEAAPASSGGAEDSDDGIFPGTGFVWDWLTWSSAARLLAQSFWPGPLTLVLSDRDARFPAGVRNTKGGVAVRVSPHPFVRALLRHWGRPLLSTSANRPGNPPARTAREAAQAAEGRPGTHRLWIADGGPLLSSDPSTVVDCTAARPTVVRAGPISVESLRKVVSELDDSG